MAKVRGNFYLQGVRGMVGRQLVVRQTKHGAVVSMAPRSPDDRGLTDKESTQREQFRQAIAYAKGAKDRPEYGPTAKVRDVSTFNVATADFLHPPEVEAIDLSLYHGRAGDIIRVRAVDDIVVTEVGILVVGEEGVLLEEGRMTQVPTDRRWWMYAATRDAPCKHVKVIVDAADLAAHIARGKAEVEL